MLSLTKRTMLGDVPDDWGAKPLRELLLEHMPGDWGDERGPNMIKVIRSTNLTNDGPLDLSDVAQRSIPGNKVARLEPRKDDLLLERSGGVQDSQLDESGLCTRTSKITPSQIFCTCCVRTKMKLTRGFSVGCCIESIVLGVFCVLNSKRHRCETLTSVITSQCQFLCLQKMSRSK